MTASSNHMLLRPRSAKRRIAPTMRIPVRANGSLLTHSPVVNDRMDGWSDLVGGSMTVAKGILSMLLPDALDVRSLGSSHRQPDLGNSSSQKLSAENTGDRLSVDRSPSICFVG